MIVSAYCRVSTDSELQERSFQTQMDFFNVEIEKRGHKLFKVYGDEGETGTQLNNRKEFKQMLYDAGIDIVESYRTDARRNKYGNIDKRIKKKHLNYEESDRKPLFDEIWVKNTSRFARNTLSYSIILALRNKGVHVYFMEQDINTKNFNADFLLQLFQLFDSQDSRDKSSKVKTGLINRANLYNTISTTNRIYGYKYKKETNSLEIIEKEAEVIREIYKLYLDGYGIRRIINELEEKEYRTRQNKTFSISTIRRILQNEKYCGTNVRNKYTYGRVFSKMSYAHINPKSEWIITENHERIPPIIDKATFEKAQEILANNVFHQKQQGVYKGISEYAGLVYCQHCGAVYYSNVDSGRRFYNCSTKKKKGTKVCNNPNVSEAKIKEFLSNDEIASSLLFYIGEQRKLLKKLEEYLKRQYSVDKDAEVKNLKLILDELESKKDRYIELFSNGIIGMVEVNKKTTPLNVKIAEVKESIELTSKHNNDLDTDITEVQEALQYLANETNRITHEYMTNTGIFTEKNIAKEIEKIIVNEDGTLEAEYKIVARLSEQFSKYNKLLNSFKKKSA